MRRHFAFLGILAVACSPASPPQPKAAIPPWGLDLSYIDSTIPPGHDFFARGNNGWTKTAIIPADRSYAGVNLELNKANEDRLKSIIAGLDQKPEAQLTAEEKKVRDLYNSYVDQKTIDSAGLKPAADDLAMIAAIRSLDDVARVMATVRLNLDGPYAVGISPDDKHPNDYAIRLYQSGLGLPDRDFYLLSDTAIVRTRDAYKNYLAQILTLAGTPNAASRAAKVYQLEHDMAVVSWSAAAREQVDSVYNPMSVSALERFVPAFPWKTYLTTASIPLKSPKGERTVIVGERSAFPKLGKIFAATPVDVWRDYLTTRYLHAFAEYLPQAIDSTDFAFFGTALTGKKDRLPRDIRAIHFVDNNIGEALGKLYVAKYFPPEAKAKAQQLVSNMLTAYQTDIKTLDWMSTATRAKALEKIAKFTPKVGYPDSWRDYSALAIGNDIIPNVQNAVAFEWRRRLTRLDEPVDRKEWEMTPPTNNAYYDPTQNEIVFPAGILQPPYFDPNADDAVNYGEIGATIGHEISHGFDDQGSKYDGDGVLKNWWTPADLKNFQARTHALAKQYDAYQPLPGMHVNGQLTLGENIADLAGLVIALKAYHIALGGKPAPVLNGYTGDQRFYLAYAQSWREIRREGSERVGLLSDPHSLPVYRVNGVVRNDDGWYAAFPEIKAGDTYWLAPEARVRLW